MTIHSPFQTKSDILLLKIEGGGAKITQLISDHLSTYRCLSFYICFYYLHPKKDLVVKKLPTLLITPQNQIYILELLVAETYCTWKLLSTY